MCFVEMDIGRKLNCDSVSSELKGEGREKEREGGEREKGD